MRHATGKLRSLGSIGLVVALLAGGCEVIEVKPPPVTLDEYEQSKADPARAYPPETVALHNLRRVLDRDLPEAQRVESLRLASHLGKDSPDVRAQLASLLADESSGETLRTTALDVLLAQDHPELAPYVARVLPKLDPGSPLKERVLAWLSRHPSPGALAEVVKLWAQEASPTGLSEPRYRHAVEALSGKKWDQALLDGINAASFGARGSALAVLAARLSPAKLRQGLLALAPRSQAILAMRTFLARFNYLPFNGKSLLTCVWLYATKGPLFDGAAAQSADWRRKYDYAFDVRDFHVLSRLARDPMRRNLPRSALIVALAESLLKRQHVSREVPRAAGEYGFSDRFSKHVESLTMGDLWKLHLLDEMLRRPRVQRALRVMAAGDRADTRNAWGGLVFYSKGQVEAKLYPPGGNGQQADLLYRLTREAARDAHDSLCRFHGHFERADNAARIGPSTEELQAARGGNYCGLVLTSLDERSFCAHYYNPAGISISLGRFPFR